MIIMLVDQQQTRWWS